MEINEFLYGLLYGAIGGMFFVWLYKCLVLRKEDHIKIVESYAQRYIRQIVGIRGYRAATKDDESPPVVEGDLIKGESPGNLDWIWWPFQRIATYEMRKIVRKNVAELTPQEQAPENNLILWGNLTGDTEVSVLKISKSNHYRRQFTYEMTFENVETGRDSTKAEAQNVKLRIRLNATVCTKNARDTMYQEGDGGKWLATLHTIILSCLNELLAKNSFAQLSDLRGSKLDDQKLGDDRITFKARINEQMLKVKHLGQETIDLDFLDYEIMPESQPFAKSLQDRAIAAVDKETSKDKAEAVKNELEPIVNAKKALIAAGKEATKDLYGTVNQTVVQQTRALPRMLRVFAGSLFSPNPTHFDTSLPDTKDIIKQSLANDIVDEIKEGDKIQKQSNKKGGSNK